MERDRQILGRREAKLSSGIHPAMAEEAAVEAEGGALVQENQGRPPMSHKPQKLIPPQDLRITRPKLSAGPGSGHESEKN